MQPGFVGFRFEQHSARRPGGTRHSGADKVSGTYIGDIDAKKSFFGSDTFSGVSKNASKLPTRFREEPEKSIRLSSLAAARP